MKKLLNAAAALLMAGTAVFGSAEAATFKPIAKGKSLVMTGELLAGDADRLVDAYNTSCVKRGFCPQRIFLDSPGGNLMAAAAVALKVNESGMHTIVGRTDSCVSACVLVFSSGSHKAVFPTSRVGVHRVHNVSQSGYGEEIATDTDSSITLTMQVAEAYRLGGVPDAVILKMVSTSGNDISWITSADWPEVEVIE